MNNQDEVYRAHLVYMNMYNGETKHEYSKPYATKGGATQAKNRMKKETFYRRNWIRNPNYVPGNGQPYQIEDPNDTRSHEEMLPFFESFTEVAATWKKL